MQATSIPTAACLLVDDAAAGQLPTGVTDAAACLLVDDAAAPAIDNAAAASMNPVVAGVLLSQ